MQPQSNKGIYILLIIILVILLANSGVNFLKLPFGASSSGKGLLTGGDSFFDSQNATVMGKITNVDNNNITVENREGSSRQFPVSRTVMISAPPSTGGIATPSADLKQIETGKDYSISLVYQNGNFEVMSIFPNAGPGAISVPPAPPTGAQTGERRGVSIEDAAPPPVPAAAPTEDSPPAPGTPNTPDDDEN